MSQTPIENTTVVVTSNVLEEASHCAQEIHSTTSSMGLYIYQQMGVPSLAILRRKLDTLSSFKDEITKLPPER
jgi:hypothetical protein